MILKVNASYPTTEGFIIPRSHVSIERGNKYLVVQVLTGGGRHYTSTYMTMTTKELKRVLALDSKDRLEII